MPDGRTTFTDLGPWKGDVEQPALCGPGAFESSFNVSILDGEITKRKGRFQLNSTFTTYPSTVALQFGTQDFYLVTPDLTTGKFNLATGVNIGSVLGTGFGAANTTIWIGAPFPFSTVNFLMGNSNTTASVLSVGIWNGTTHVTPGGLTDNTVVSGKTLDQSASVYFTGAVGAWQPEQPIVNGVRLPRLYYWQVTTSAQVFAGTTINELTLEMGPSIVTGNGGANFTATGGQDRRTAINGIVYMQLPSGERQILVGMDEPFGGFARLFVYFWNRKNAVQGATGIQMNAGIFRAVLLPPSVARTGVGAYWRGVPYGGKLILTNGYTPPLVYDGVSCEPLNALWGADSVQGSRAYTPAPTARFFAAYNSALYAAGIQGAPRTVQRSENQNALNVFTGSEQEQVGGANYWPVGQDFDVSTGDATRPETSEITGLGVVGGRLAILTRERSYLYDDSPELLALGGNSGCIAPSSFATVGDFGFYLGDRTVWKITAEGGLEQIGLPIDPTLRSVLLSTQAIAVAVAVISPAYHEYRLYVPVGGDDRNRTCLVYDYLNNTWTRRGGIPPGAPNQLGGGGSDPYANLNTYFISSVARVNEIGEPEIIFTGDYTGTLYLEDEGFSDVFINPANLTAQQIYPIFAYFITHRIGKESSDRKLFREMRIFMRKEGGGLDGVQALNIKVLMVTDEVDALGAFHSALIEGRTGDYLSQTASGDFIVPGAEKETWFGRFGFVASNHTPSITAGPTAGTARWVADEFRPFKYSMQPSASGLLPQKWTPTVQFVIFSTEAQAPFSIRGYELAFTESPETRR